MAIRIQWTNRWYFINLYQNVNTFLTYFLTSFWDTSSTPYHFVNEKKYLDKNLQSDGRCIHFHIYRSICYRMKYPYSNSNSSHIPDEKCIVHLHILKQSFDILSYQYEPKYRNDCNKYIQLYIMYDEYWRGAFIRFFFVGQLNLF